jgi:hypothetical protein
MRSERVIAVTTQRSEPDWLIDDLMANLRLWVADVLVLQVPKTGPWGHEGEQNATKREMLRKAGATWVLFVDPDERIEDRAAELVPPILHAAYQAGNRHVVYGFPLREMWTPDAYRVDGNWGEKMPRHRLFWLRRDASYPHKPIHSGTAPLSTRRYREVLPVNMYHLKNIEPSNRVERAKAYMNADPDFVHQRAETSARNWDWMADETGLQLEGIPPGRGFTPPYSRPYAFTAPA